jgi:hypothetical protein
MFSQKLLLPAFAVFSVATGKFNSFLLEPLPWQTLYLNWLSLKLKESAMGHALEMSIEKELC